LRPTSVPPPDGPGTHAQDRPAVKPGNRSWGATVSAEMSHRLRRLRLALPLVVLLTAAGCAPGGSPGPSGGPSPSPSAASLGIEHLTGATDLVLRFEEGGGFVAPGFLATEGPAFSLYGDGTTIFRDPSAVPPQAIGNVTPGVPYQIVRLTEEQIQALLEFAIGPGGLGVARAHYDLPVADAPTATFTLVAGGTTKTVSVNGLGFGAQQAGADGIVLSELEALRTRLTTLGNDVVGEQPWSPDRYRGILTEEGFNPPIAWPWPAISPTDFIQHAGPNDPPFPIRTMTPAEVAALGVSGLEGGAQGITLKASDGKTYELRLRPLLPDEAY
jgi:hypothetical protein